MRLEHKKYLLTPSQKNHLKTLTRKRNRCNIFGVHGRLQ